MIINAYNDYLFMKTNLKHIRHTKTIVTTLTEKKNIPGQEKFYQFHGLISRSIEKILLSYAAD